MKILDLIQEAAKTEVSAQIEFSPMPEGATVLGELPEELRPFFIKVTETAKDLNCIRQAIRSETDEEKAKELKKEFQSIYNKGIAVGSIFWCELHDIFGIYDGNMDVTDGWQVWHMEEQERCCSAIMISLC